jgi:hypothetical protein
VQRRGDGGAAEVRDTIASINVGSQTSSRTATAGYPGPVDFRNDSAPTWPSADGKQLQATRIRFRA